MGKQHKSRQRHTPRTFFDSPNAEREATGGFFCPLAVLHPHRSAHLYKKDGNGISR